MQQAPKAPVMKAPYHHPLVDRQSDIKKHSKVRLIEHKVIEIYRKYPNIYQAEVAQMLTKHFKL